MVWGETARCSRDIRGKQNRQDQSNKRLANTNRNRFGSRPVSKSGDLRFPGRNTLWPAAPGKDQYEWEEPRTIWKTKSELGGTLDGFANRVDRLRLLGNGVVPQTAAMAWLELSERLENA